MRTAITTSLLAAATGTFLISSSATAIAQPTGTSGTASQVGPQSVSSQPTATPDAEPLEVRRKSSKCNSPRGKRFNVSWGTGSLSTTFYFNNHCNKKRRIVVRTHYGELITCIVVNPRTSGQKRVGYPTGQIGSVKLPKSKCPRS
ncbi:hypothetical protein GCM10023085_16450 [Actinomadura viridis]